jgi:hypothetical protein
VGFAPSPFRLSNVLSAPQMVHNLLSIRQFTTDNFEFDACEGFGFPTFAPPM